MHYKHQGQNSKEWFEKARAAVRYTDLNRIAARKKILWEE